MSLQMTLYPYGRRERFLLWLAWLFAWVSGRLRAKAKAMCVVTKTITDDSRMGKAHARLMKALGPTKES